MKGFADGAARIQSGGNLFRGRVQMGDAQLIPGLSVFSGFQHVIVAVACDTVPS